MFLQDVEIIEIKPAHVHVEIIYNISTPGMTESFLIFLSMAY